VAADIEPFSVVDNDNGTFSLLLSEFEPTDELFEEVGSLGPGYAWETVALYVVENIATELADRLDFDSEHSMFCAFGKDREALQALGVRLARLFRDERALAKIIKAIGRRGFDLFGD